MSEQHRSTIIDAEVLAVTGGIEEATGHPVVCLTLRPITGSGWSHANYALTVENAEALAGRLHAALHGPLVKPHRRSGSDPLDAPFG